METVRKRKSPPLGKRPWTPEDENYLAEKWGYASVPAIAKKLNRTENAVVVRAQRLGLGSVSPEQRSAGFSTTFRKQENVPSAENCSLVQ